MFILAMACAYAETWIYGDFENGDLSGTVLVDADGDTNNWQITTTNPYAGTYAVESVSDGLTPDNWFISPQLYAERYDDFNYPHIKFWVGAEDVVNYSEHYQILVSYSDTDTASFFPVYEETLTSSDWKEVDIDLKPFFGMYQWDATMYVAIRHFDSSGQSALLFDEFSVYSEPSFWFDTTGDFTQIFEGTFSPMFDMDMRISPYDRSMYDEEWNFVGMDIRMHYILSDGVTFQPEDTLEMVWNSDPTYTDTYICTFPGQAMGTFMEYWFEGTDNSELSYVGKTQHFNVEWGEVNFIENFEDSDNLPEGWNTFQILIDDFVSDWDQSWTVNLAGQNVYEGNNSITSAAQANFGVYETEDYLVSPQLRADGNSILRYYINQQSPEGYTDIYSVLINTVGNDSVSITNSSEVLLADTLLSGVDDNLWSEVVIDLQPWDGQTFWIAFKHDYVPTVKKLDRYLNIDNISISQPPIVEVEGPGNAAIPDEPFEITVTATDYSGIESAKLYYSIDGGSEIEVVMTDNGDDTFTGFIPGQVKYTKAVWYAIITDDSGFYNKTLTDTYNVIWFSDGWLEWGVVPGVYPDDPYGPPMPWKAAIDWNFESKEDLYLNGIEARFRDDEIVTWKLVEFDGLPTDNVLGTLEGIANFNAGEATVVSVPPNQNKISGHVALVLEIDGGSLYRDASADMSHTWKYGVSWMPNSNGTFHMRMYVSTDSSGINNGEFIANTTELCQNYPNPFNPSTSISFFNKENGKVNLAVFNVKGEKVASLVNGNLERGYHKINFDATRLNSGVYYYTLITPEANITKKMVLVK